WDAIARADALLFLRDLTRLGEPGYDMADAAIAQRLPPAWVGAGRLVTVFNKADVASASSLADGLVVSAKTGAGLDTLRQRLLALAGWHAVPEGLFIARARHVQALRRTREHLIEAQAQADRIDPALD